MQHRARVENRRNQIMALFYDGFTLKQDDVAIFRRIVAIPRIDIKSDQRSYLQ
jgi:hypothetical protein